MRRVASHAAVVVLLLLAGTVPSAATMTAVGLSRDGVTFAPSLDAPLFDPAIRWVPGDVRAESFYVRNMAQDDADLTIDVVGAGGDSLLGTGDVMVSTRGAEDDPWRDVMAPGTHRVVSATDLVAGRTTRVDVKVALLPEAANTAQVRRLDLHVHVLLARDVGRPLPESSGLLPDTGAPTSWSIIAGLCLVGAGIILVRRRREKENPHV